MFCRRPWQTPRAVTATRAVSDFDTVGVAWNYG
jgi:hypothetical protein